MCECWGIFDIFFQLVALTKRYAPMICLFFDDKNETIYPIEISGHAFGIILDELENTPIVPSGTAFVLNAVGSIFFANRDYDGAIERFEESLSLKNDELSPCQKAGALCNIATAYFKMGNYEESEVNFDRALSVAESAGDRASEVKATIMSKFGYILYKRRQYLHAYKLFSNGKIVS